MAKVTASLTRNEGRYSVGIPWEEGEPKLENNYDVALERLKSQEKILRRKGSEAMQAYDKIILEYERKGYVKKVRTNNDKNQWFLPHFAVIKEDRTTTKTRMVFDAAAKNRGKSLNDAIHPGPKLQKDLLTVLIRFRRAPVALSGDISEMFLQVGLREEDRRYHRFLWRSFDASQEPSVYEFQSLVFGNTASPFCAQFVIQNHAEMKAADYPKAADTVNNSMYVDDVLDSLETPQEAIELRRQLSEMLNAAHFHLRKWSSNDRSVLEDVPTEDRQPDIEIREDGRPTGKLKTLGVTWRSENDVFTFNVQPPVHKESATKREVLSSISTLFDPLQLLSPFTIRAKILMQDLWSAGLDWDDTLSKSLFDRWQHWADELQRLSTFEIPRCLRKPSPDENELHMFSDASKEAYAACGYLVCRYEDSTATSVLIASKCRVAPIKVISIPRLELMGAVISTRLASTILRSIAVSKVVFWTDSTNVLYWVKNQSRNFKTFVANRIGEIQKTTNPEQWRHVPGELNPADLATRGISASELAKSKVWKEGPEFLLGSETVWPARLTRVEKTQGYVAEERKNERTHVALISDENGLNPRNFSSFYHLVRLTAWVRRFASNCRQKEANLRLLTANFTVDEVKQAEIFWFKRAQIESFQDDVRQKCLQNLNPMKDEDGLLRIDGRLRHAELPYESKHPVILPKEHPITKLVVQSVHEKLGHGTGVEHTLCELRSRFWVIKGRRLVREVLHHCQACKRRFNAKPVGQMVAPLPRQRVTSSMKAFDHVGVDYGGPYLTKQGRGKTRAKRYLCLFTCLVTRAVHLEMAYSLDTNSFINAFARMVSRRGTPSYVISDNGTNYVAGERELRELVQKLNQEKIIRESSRLSQIEWHFNPPAGPHFAGVYEVMIKSAKKAIRSILGDAEVSDEELHTAICGAERLLNSRPITYVSSDATDLCPLTPDHFIHGQLGGKFAAEAGDEETLDVRKRWHRVQQLINQVWKRWRKELLPTLNRRKKWFHPERSVKEGDVVLMIEPNANRCGWPLGRILETYPGDDGLVRVVRLKARGNEYLRPVHRLCPLEYV